MKTGTHRDTGKPLGGLAYLRQRFRDVITTPKGSVVGARDFGSRIYEMQDRNVDPQFYMAMYIRVAEACSHPANGLDDFKLDTIQVSELEPNHFLIDVTGTADTGERVTVDGVLLEL